MNIIEKNRIKLLKDDDIEIKNYRAAIESFEDYKQKLDDHNEGLSILSAPVELQELFRSLANSIVGRAKVFSMSENWSSPHLWAHYADSHKGFCLGFEYDTNVKSRFLLEKIEYSEKIPTVDAVDIFKYYNSSRKSINMTRKLYCTKSKHWSFEDEYRMLYLSIKNPPDTIFSIPEGIYVVNKNMKLKTVIFGMKSSKNDIKIVTDILKQFDVKGVDFFLSTEFDENYNVLKRGMSVI